MVDISDSDWNYPYLAFYPVHPFSHPHELTNPEFKIFWIFLFFHDSPCLDKVIDFQNVIHILPDDSFFVQRGMY